MSSALNRFLKRLKIQAIALCIGICIIAIAFPSNAYAARTSMSGDYVKDTISVVHQLKEIISVDQDNEERSSEGKESIGLITDYISRYRNRPQVNGSVSFTTMQTALNAMAGHYKTFANRPLPQDLKERLNKELSKAEKIVTNEF